MNRYEERYVQEEVKTKAIDYDLIKRLLRYLLPYRYWVILAIAALVIARAIEAWVPIQIGQIVQTMLNHQGASVLQKRTLFHQLLLTGFFITGWILVSYILDILNIWMKNWIGQKAIFNLRTQVYDHIQRLPMSFYDHYPIGRLMTRTIHDVEQINQLFSESAIPLLGSLILFAGIFIGLFFLNWQIGILLCFILPFMWWLTRYFRYNQRKSYNAIRSIVSAMNTFIQEHLMGMNVIRSFGLHPSEKEKFNQLNRDHFEANVDTIHYFAFFFSGIDILQNLTMISVFALLVFLIPPGANFEAGTYFTISIYSLMVFRPLFDLAERYNVLQSALAAAERVFEILDMPLEPFEKIPNAASLKVIETVVFDDVWFAYEKENWVLKGLSFTLHKGESIAFVGVTGSGKTSIINILLRLYEFQKGRILINGKDIRDYDIADLRSQFSVILQDPVIFSGTIYENITLYDPLLTMEKVQAGAQYVSLNPTVERFSDGFEHVLHERGIGLSVGEMQLISLARAVAHHRSVLIFDEATANIDAQTEMIIQRSLKKILTNQTALVIAHRLSTLKDVSRILVLYQGQVAESGTHQQLLEAKGIYEKLYRLQFVGNTVSS